MRRKNDIGFLFVDNCDNFFDRRRCERLLRSSAGHACFQYGRTRRDISHVEYLGPAKAEPAISDYQAVFFRRKLTRHSLHSECAAARHNGHRVGVVHLFQRRRYVRHRGLKRAGHVIDRAVRVDDRIFEQTVRIDVGQQAGHMDSPCNKCILVMLRIHKWQRRPHSILHDTMEFSRFLPHSSHSVINTNKKMKAAQTLRIYTDRSNEIHREYLGNPVLRDQYTDFVAWQVQYMSPFYEDHRSGQGHAAAVDFFISDLTGINISRRDQDLAKVVPVMTRMLPDRALQALADAMTLNARVLEINLSICQELFRDRELDNEISERDYCLACRRASSLEECLELVSLTRLVGEDLQRIIKIPILGVILRAMRSPARLAGFGEMQDFLETGYRTFSAVDDVNRFLDDMSIRTTEIFTSVYNEPLENLQR